MQDMHLLPDGNGNIRFTGENANGIVCPKIVQGNVDFPYLKYADGLVLPKHVSGNLRFPNLESAKELILPKRVSGYLDLRTLKNVDGLVLPSHVGSSLILCNVTSAKNLVFPKYVGTNIDLNSLASTTGLVFPKHIGEAIWLQHRTNTEPLVLHHNQGHLRIFGNLFAKIGEMIFRYSVNGSAYMIFPVLRAKKELGAWLEKTKNFNIPKWLLVWSLARVFKEHEINVLIDNILAAKMLIS
jgi:hypothetical protein